MIATNEKRKNNLNTTKGEQLNHVRENTTRKLTSLYGDVNVTRMGYSQRHHSSLFPIDAQLNLAKDQYSDGLRFRFCKEIIRGSYDNAIESVGETTGGFIPKRQGLKVVQEVSRDFESYYQTKRFLQTENTSDLLVLTFDGKGIVMRPDGLRECTKKRAAKKCKNLKHRLSPGEKKDQKRSWVVLIDGLPHQIELVNKIMKRLKVTATIIMDFIHVLEYLWKAAWCFYDKGDNAVEEWIAEKAEKILNGQCSQVAKGIRICATKLNLANRENIDKCADYLNKNKGRLRYGEALKAGFPIASGVIEGACRHPVNILLQAGMK